MGEGKFSKFLLWVICFLWYAELLDSAFVPGEEWWYVWISEAWSRNMISKNSEELTPSLFCLMTKAKWSFGKTLSMTITDVQLQKDEKERNSFPFGILIRNRFHVVNLKTKIYMGFHCFVTLKKLPNTNEKLPNTNENTQVITKYLLLWRLLLILPPVMILHQFSIQTEEFHMKQNNNQRKAWRHPFPWILPYGWSWHWGGEG